MGYKQTAQHRFGRGSYHQIGLVRGQFGNVPMEQWLKFIQDSGFDGWEEASWELDLSRCASDAAAVYRDQKLLLVNAAVQSFVVHFSTAALYSGLL